MSNGNGTVTRAEMLRALHTMGVASAVECDVGDYTGVRAFCPVCAPGRVIWTEQTRKWVCDKPTCPSRKLPRLIPDKWDEQHPRVGGFADSNGNGHRNGEVVVVPDPRETTQPDRYEGRFYDLGDLAVLLAKPPRPIPWRVHNLVADGTLTIVSGESGSGKSWLAQALCTGVARGHTVAGLPCRKGDALYIDGEMGRDMFVDDRLRAAGVTTPEFRYIEAMGLDVSKPDDLAYVEDRIRHVGANLVVIDSFRRLVPSKAENDSDDMAPAVAALAKLARDTRAAILLIHHKGDGEKSYRGSTAIKDQADALFALLKDPDDENAPRRLRCRGKGKMRYAPEPPDVFLTVDPEAGGVAGSDPPEDSGPVIPVRQAVAEAIRAALPVQYKKEAAEKIGRHDKDQTFRDAWGDLERAGEIVQISGHWTRGSSAPSLGSATTTTSGFGSAPSSDSEAA